jgi:hypothetical protein
MPDPVYSQPDMVAPVPSVIGPIALGPVAGSPSAAAASSLVSSEQAVPGACALAAAVSNQDEDINRVAVMVMLAERMDLRTLPPRVTSPIGIADGLNPRTTGSLREALSNPVIVFRDASA